jgi:hypothetical protein
MVCSKCGHDGKDKMPKGKMSIGKMSKGKKPAIVIAVGVGKPKGISAKGRSKK